MKKYLLIFGLFLFIAGCTSLDEELEGSIDAGTAAAAGNAADILTSAYQALNAFGTQDNIWALAEHTSDELAGPTRGPDWDDGGVWRDLHTHNWASSSNFVNSSWGGQLSGVFRATQVLEFLPTPQQEAEAKFLRAFFSFHVLDGWGLVLGREPGEDLTQPPSIFLGRAEGIDFVIAELEESVANLPETNPGRATKNAARALLAKAYLNRAVYKATNADGGAQKGPFTFDAADMNKVIQYADQVINSGQFSLDEDYFDNFRPDNANLSSENIFVKENALGGDSGNIASRWFMTLHYNQTPGGWNGFVALSDLYDSFEDSDIRRGLPHEDFPELDGKTGVDVGFLIGQQFDKDENKIKDRPGADLVITKDFSLTNSNERQGVRVIKYVMDFNNLNNPENDYVLLRYADVLLMKAEAILRGGTPTGGQTALSIVNELRSVRNTGPCVNLDLTELLKERSRELYWEGWRRNDQIRFSTYLNAFQEKPVSTEKFLLFPIPPSALSLNPNLTQNPGY